MPEPCRNSKGKGAALGLAALAGLVFAACGGEPAADRIFTNGNILTMDETLPKAEAFAVAAGRIVSVGTTREIRTLHPGVEDIDLEGATVMPGIVESHVHLLNLGQSFLELNVEEVESPAEVVEKVEQRVASAQPGEWITGWGWDEGAWARRYPSNEDLSSVSPQNPVWLRGLHGFAGWANARALEIAGIDEETPNPENGEILKDPRTGVPTGILTNKAQDLLTRHIPPMTQPQMEKAFTIAMDECLKYGLTTLHDARVSRGMLEALRSLRARNSLECRIYAMLDCTDPDLIGPFLADGPEIDPEHWLTARCIKIFADGALGSRGAAFFEPYSDAPETRGLLTTPEEEIYRLTLESLKAGMQVSVHAIGDRANRITLDAFAAALEGVPSARDHRLRIEHAQVVALEDIPRFADLGVISSMQPPHCTSDMPWAEDRTGPDRIRGAYAWRLFMDAGVRVPLNSDFPGETLNPFWGMYAAETRQTPDGDPEGGWFPDQCLTREEVLRAYTVESAYAGFQEEDLGRIAPGKLADFIVLSDDIESIPSKALLSLRVVQTYVGGRLVFGGEDRPRR